MNLKDQITNRLRIVRDIYGDDKWILWVVAPTRASAKSHWISEMCMEHWTDCWCRLFKWEHNIDLSRERTIDWEEWLRNWIYYYIDEKCEACEQYWTIYKSDDWRILCWDCKPPITK